MATSARYQGSISLEEWIALNDEIQALVRAGLPLERGLMSTHGEYSGSLGEITRNLSARLARGESLERALEEEGPRLPPIYRAVVKAGVRSGRLADALESLSAHIRHHTELRRLVSLSLIYPLVLVLVAYGLFLLLLLFTVPRFLSAFDSLRIPGLAFLRWLNTLGETAYLWAWIPPALLFLLVLVWRLLGRAGNFASGSSRSLLSCIPGARKIHDDAVAASFAEMLALLLDHGTPLPEALELAASSTGETILVQEGNRLAETVRRGEPMPEHSALPPLLKWLMGSRGGNESLPRSLRHAALHYRRTALFRSQMLRIMLPLVAVVCVGGLTVLAFGLSLFVPFATLLRQVADLL